MPEYLQPGIGTYAHYGRGGIAAAFMNHIGIEKTQPRFHEYLCGVSNCGRHVLYKALSGPLASDFYYGDLKTKQTIRWQAPKELVKCNAMDIVWVETPK